MSSTPDGTGQSRASSTSNKQRAVVTVAVIDVVVPIAFPDYRISTPIGGLPYLGHAGVLFWRGRDGSSRYYEYGRYDRENRGLVRRKRIPDVALARNGRPRRASLMAVLRSISSQAGHGGRIEAAWIEVPGKFQAMLDYVTARMEQNTDPKRTEYSLLSNNCMTFVKQTVEAGGVGLPLMLDPRPNSYIAEVQYKHPPLRYAPPAANGSGGLSVKGVEILD